MSEAKNSHFLLIGSFLFILSLAFIGACCLWDNTLKASYYMTKAESLDRENPYGSIEALKYYNKSASIYKKLNKRNDLAENYIKIGFLHNKFGNILQVERYMNAALALGDDDFSDNFKTKIYLLLSSILTPDSSLKYIDKALSVASIDIETKVKAYMLRANALEGKAQFEKAEASYLTALKELQASSSSNNDEAVLYESLAEIYLGGGNIDKAIDYLGQARNFYQKAGNVVEAANFTKKIGDLYNEKKLTKQACHYWTESIKQYENAGSSIAKSVSGITETMQCGQYPVS